VKRVVGLAVEFWQADRSLTALLALLLILLFVVTPLAQLAGVGALLNGVVFTLLAITGTAAVTRRSAIVAVVALIGLARLMLDVFTRDTLAQGLVLGDLMVRTGLVLVIAVLVTAQILRPGNISHHRVQGAIAIYLLAALAWAYAYEMLHLLDPRSFHIAVTGDTTPNLALFRFFSFETLTTLGYSEVMPVGPFARALTASEGLFGQLFPVVMITRLVSLEIAERTARRHS
jgi:hypothetical protein